MNFSTLFQDFNASKFLVFCCLLVFSVLLSLKFDDYVSWSYWNIFLPLWFWKFMAVCGASVGSYIWWHNPQYRVEGGFIEYKAMMISVALHLLLLSFEMLVCDKLENGHNPWTLTFIPLVFLSLFAIAASIWSFRHDRTFELELFCAVNMLQFIFIALRLDKIIIWSWVVVLIPTWIVMCVALIGVLYAVILAIILLRSPHIVPEQRQGNVYSAIAYTLIVLPLLCWLIMLTNKLDYLHSRKPFILICLPLYVSLLTLVFMCFGSKGGNRWWFGIRKDFCHFLLGVCPPLQEYGNISYTMQSNSTEESLHNSSNRDVCKSDSSSSSKGLIDSEFRPVVSIETPD